MVKLYRINALWLLMLMMAWSFVSKGQGAINSPSGAIVPFGFNTSYTGNGILPTNLPTGGTYGQATDAANAYNAWKNNYISWCTNYTMARVNFDTPSETVSEGIGYGMLLAAYAADQTLFNALYAFYLANTNGNGFMNWEVTGCGANSVQGQNGATDADEDVAMALIIASNQWPNATSPYNYKNAATTMIGKIYSSEIYNNQAINGDQWGTSSTCRDPSYQAPAYYREFGTFTGNTAQWNAVAAGGYGLITNNASSIGLVTDWSDNNGNPNTCNGSSQGTYGYDACRNPWRMATDVIWHGSTTAATGYSQLNKIAAFINSTGAGNVGGPIQQTGGTGTHNATFVSTFAMGLVGASSTYQNLLNQMYTQTVNTQDAVSGSYPSGYFGNTLRVLSLFVMSGNFWKPGTTSNQKIALSVTDAATGQTTATPVPTTTTFNFEDVEYTNNSTNTATFTISNPGSKVLTISGSPLVTLTGASVFTITQPTSATIAANGSETFTVKFAPTSPGGNYTATLTINSNDPVTPSYTITLVGTGTATATAPLMAVNKSGTGIASNGTSSWGYVTVKPTTLPANNPSPYVSYTNFNVTNTTGTGPLNITGITTTGTGFSVTKPASFPLSVNPGATGTFQIAYAAPTTAGPITGKITIASNDPINPSYVINITGTVAACADTNDTKVLIDYDANNNVSLNFLPNGTGSVKDTTNPYPGPLDSTQTVMRYTRPATGTYNTIRYQPCTAAGGTFSITTHPLISMLIWSPAKGINVILSPKLNATTSANADVTSTTTVAGGWQRLYFNLSAVTSAQAIEFLDIEIDPTNTLAKATNYYIDDIQYDVNPCVSDLPTSNIFDDFDTHINVSLQYNVTGLNQAVNNPVTTGTGLDVGGNVAEFVRPYTAGTGGQYIPISYSACNGSINLFPAGFTGISMLVYSPAAGIPVEMSLQTSANAAIAGGNVTVNTTKSGQWEELYFDFSASAGITTAKYLVLFFDPLETYTTATSNNTYYFDNIRYNVAPCISGIASTGILDDFDSNRWLTYENTSAGATYNDVLANPVPATADNSATVAEWVRPATGKYAYFQYQGCKSNFNLTQGKTVFSLQIYSPAVGVPVSMQFLKANGTTVLNTATATTTVANAWQTLIFDQSAILDSTSAAYMNIMIDTGAAFVGTAAARTYYIDNIQYAAAAPYMNVVANGVTKAPTTNVNFGSVTVSDSLVYTFVVQNNGTQPLALSGTPVVSVTGTNAASFIVRQATTQSSVSPGSSTAFTVTFKPTTSGAQTATLSIANNDGRTGFNPYIVYLNGTASGAKMAVTYGTSNTGIATAGTYTFTPAVAVSSSSAAVTFTISNSGNTALALSGTSYVAVSGTNAADFTVVQPTAASIAASGSETFTVTFKPTAAGTRTAALTIASNDPASPYVINLSGSSVPATPTISTTTATNFCAGGSVLLTATTTSSPVTYQWSNGAGTIAGATNATYTASPTATTTYTVTVYNNTVSATSTGTTVTVNPNPTVSVTNPTAVCSPSTVDITATSVTAGSTAGLTYTYWTNAGATTTLTTPSAIATSGTYYIKGATTAGCSATTPVTVTVNALPTVVITNPSPVCSPNTINLTAAAVTAGSTSGLTYTYWTNAGATTTLSSPSAVATSGTYYIKGTVAGSGCNAISPVTVAVNTTPSTPTISITNGSASFCSGGSVTLGANPSSGYSYQWLNGGSIISAATNATYTTTTAGSYTVTVGSTGCSATSTGTTVTVYTNPTVTVTNPAAVCSPATVNLTAAGVTSGSSTGLTYTYWADAGASSSLSSPSAVSASGTYYIKGTNSNTCSAIAPVTVTVNAQPIVSITNPVAVCSPSTVDLTAALVTIGSTAGLSYSYWTNAGATSSLSAPATVSATGTYYIKGTIGGTGCSIVEPVTATINPLPSVVITSPASVCSPSTVDLTAAAVTSGSTSGLTYSYWADASATSSLSSPSSIAASGTYYIEGATASGCSVIQPVTVTVTPANNVSVSIASSSSATCSGTPVTFTATAQGSGLSYQWVLNDPTNGTSNVGTNSASYNTSTLKDEDQVWCVVTSTGVSCTIGSPATSNTITETIATSGAPTISIQSNETGSTVCSGTAIEFSIASSTYGGPGATYQWYDGATAIGGATGSAYSSTTLTGNDVISCVMTSSLSCATSPTATSNSLTPNVTAQGTAPCADPAPQTISGPTTVTQGQTATVTYTIGSPNLSSTYTWSIPTGATFVSIGQDSTSITISLAGVTGTGTQAILVTETNSFGFPTTSSLSITVNPSTTGVFGFSSAQGITVSPNPFSSTTTVNFACTSAAQLSIKVYDMTGITVYTSDAYSTNQNISLGAELGAGMYVVQAIYNDQIQTIKIIKSE